MMKPKLASGTRDFGPDVLAKRMYIIDKIKTVFEQNAYTPIETPAIEQLDTLVGKYGEEGDKLMFKILNNGLHEKSADKKAKINQVFAELMEQGGSSTQVTERALKYDLTIPFARYVAMNSHDITYPYRRYQIQPVWRADRPQKGRYREFWQCDADVIGIQSVAYDAELLVIYDDVFESLGLPDITLHVNHRKILSGIADYLELADALVPFTIIMDKLDKIGWEKVQAQLIDLGANSTRLSELESLLTQKQDTETMLHQLRALGSNSDLDTGIFELQKILEYIKHAKSTSYSDIRVDPALARGLDYYTGMIVEVKSGQTSGSLGGGGRYDNLTAIFGLDDVAGVGVSFGLDRIYNLLEESSLYPEDITTTADLLVYLESSDLSILSAIESARRSGLQIDTLYDETKKGKVYKLAERKGIIYVAIWDDEHAEKKTLIIKNTETGGKIEGSIEEIFGNFLDQIK